MRMRKVKCVELNGWNSLTLGKIYDVKNDFVEDYPNLIRINCDDDGDVFSYSRNCFEDYVEENTESQEKHVHHDLIVEWAKNPKRVVEIWDELDCEWIRTTNPMWMERNQYRFTDTVVKERVFPVTSLLTSELWEIYNKAPTNDCLKDVANAAIKQYILDMEEGK
jgi:hypothetical protein